jgi:hypothetical protein
MRLKRISKLVLKAKEEKQKQKLDGLTKCLSHESLEHDLEGSVEPQGPSEPASASTTVTMASTQVDAVSARAFATRSRSRIASWQESAKLFGDTPFDDDDPATDVMHQVHSDDDDDGDRLYMSSDICARPEVLRN